MCRTNYIGIKGECYDTDPTLYLDSLPGVNLIAASNFTNETLIRPKDLVEKCYEQAEKEVLADVLSKTGFQYNSIIEDKTYQQAGTYSYYGLNSDTVQIKCWKRGSDKFVKLHVFDFEIVSDRIATVDFVISDAYGVVDTVTIELQVGLNTIDIDHFTKSEYLKITFDLDLFKIGVRESYANYQSGTCRPCAVSCEAGCTYVEINKSIGFNMSVRCEADECQIIKYLGNVLDLPLLYKTGILYLLEAKASGRVNSYLTNKSDAIDMLLMMWSGGSDSMGNNYPSIYYGKVKQAASQIEQLMKKIKSAAFTYEGSFISNHLPG